MIETFRFNEISATVFRKQLRAMVSANLRARYRNTYSGFLWVIFNPVLMFGAQAFAFHYVLRINVDNFLLFLLSGLVPWIFISQSVDMGTPILLSNGRLLKSFPIHPMMLVSAQVVDNFINFCAAFFVLLFPVSFVSQVHWESIFYVPIGLVILLIGVCAMVSFLSVVQVKFQDMKFIMSFFNSVSFFVTPIFFGELLVPKDLHWIFWLNPYYHLILPFRLAMLSPGSPEFFERSAISFVVAVLMAVGAYFFWKRKRNELYLNL